MLLAKYNLQKFTSPWALSVELHCALLLMLLLGDFSSAPPKPTPVAAPMQPIQAVAVERKTVEAQINKIKQKKAAEEKKIRDAKRKKELERQRKINEQKRKAAEKKAQALAAKKAREKKAKEQAAAKAKAKRLKQEKLAAEKRKKEQAEALRKQKETELKRKLAEQKRKAQEAKELAQQQKLLEQQMAEEMASRQQARRQQMMTEIGRFTALIKQTIARHLLTDQSTMTGKSCKLTISLAPSGFVTNVVANRGDAIVCDAAKKAIYQAGSLPVSKDPEVFKEMRTISLTVVPEF